MPLTFLKAFALAQKKCIWDAISLAPDAKIIVCIPQTQNIFYNAALKFKDADKTS